MGRLGTLLRLPISPSEITMTELEKHRSARQAWIIENSNCPACATGRLLRRDRKIKCASCSAEVNTFDGALNFISVAAREAYGIEDTDNVSAHNYDTVARKIIAESGMVLDCGSGKKDVTFPNLIQSEVVAYPSVDLLAVNQALPFRDSCFDAVLSLDVLEHVDQPFDCAAEILRVLKPGGQLYCNVPFLQREHGYPHHYFGMTRMGIRRLFGDQIDVVEHRVPASGHPMWALWMMLQTYRDGLPKALRDDFHQLRVADILDKNPSEWINEPLATALAEDAQWRIATTTSLIAVRR